MAPVGSAGAICVNKVLETTPTAWHPIMSQKVGLVAKKTLQKTRVHQIEAYNAGGKASTTPDTASRRGKKIGVLFPSKPNEKEGMGSGWSDPTSFQKGEGWGVGRTPTGGPPHPLFVSLG